MEISKSVDRRWVVGAPVGVDVVVEPDPVPTPRRHFSFVMGRGIDGRWVAMHRGERRRSNRTTDPRRELITRSGCRGAGRVALRRPAHVRMGYLRPLDFAKIRVIRVLFHTSKRVDQLLSDRGKSRAGSHPPGRLTERGKSICPGTRKLSRDDPRSGAPGSHTRERRHRP